MLDPDSPLAKAKSAISISDAWKRLDLPGKPKRSCKAHWRNDRKASLSVFGEGRLFKDHGSNKYGDVVEFISVAENINKSEATKLLLRWHKESGGHDYKPLAKLKLTPSKKPKKLIIPKVDRGSIEELATLCNSRSLPVFVALELLHDRGLFGFCYHSGTRCWILKDSAIRNSQIRPVDPVRAGWAFKAKSIPGSDTRWPIGASSLKDTSVVLATEGTPDLLAVATAAWLQTNEAEYNDIGFCCITGASVSIALDALPLFADKRVRLFVHTDTAGIRARDRWAQQLSSVTSHIDMWHSSNEGEDFNDWASRHWMNSEDGYTLPCSVVPTGNLPGANFR